MHKKQVSRNIYFSSIMLSTRLKIVNEKLTVCKNDHVGKAVKFPTTTCTKRNIFKLIYGASLQEDRVIPVLRLSRALATN